MSVRVQVGWEWITLVSAGPIITVHAMLFPKKLYARRLFPKRLFI